MLRRREFLLGLVAAVPARALLAQSWPQFRGPGARGIAADDPRLPDSWSQHDNVLWSLDVPGRGWASPVVSGDQVFVHSTITQATDSLPKTGNYGGRQQNSPTVDSQRYMVYSFDFQSGKQRWATELYSGVPNLSTHAKNSFTSETAATDGQRLYVHVGRLGTYCLDMNGKIVWSKQWPPVDTRYGYGTGSSPVLHEGRLYILNDNETQSYIVALDKLTGKEIWRANRMEPTTWSTPYIWQNELRTEIVTAGSNKVRSYDLDGKLLWEISGMTQVHVPTPFSDGGLLYVSSGYGQDPVKPVYVIKPGAQGDITLAKDATSNQYIVWYSSTAGPYVPSPLVYQGLYYTLLDRGFVTCHDAKTGKEIYGRQRIDPAGGDFSASPWAYNDRLFCLNELGDTYVIQTGPEFKVLGKNELADVCLSSPAIVNGSLVLRTFKKLYRIGKKA